MRTWVTRWSAGLRRDEALFSPVVNAAATGVAPDDRLEQAAAPYIEEMLATSPMGLRMTKEGLNLSIDAPSLEAAMAIENRNQLMCTAAPEFAERMRAFVERRS